MTIVDILTSPIINGTPSGSAMPITIRKIGSLIGTYTTVSATYEDVDSTRLSSTCEVPIGWVANISLSGFGNVAGGGNGLLAIFDGSTEVVTILTASATNIPFFLRDVVVGDGKTHTFKARFNVSAGSFNIGNVISAQAIRLIVDIYPSR